MKKTIFTFLLSFTVFNLIADNKDILISKRNELFVENKGQLQSTDLSPASFIKYYSKGKNLNLYFTNNEIYYVFEKPVYKKNDSNKIDEFSPSNIDHIETNTIKLKLIGANPNAIIETNEKTQYVENFYLNNCPNGLLNVNTFRSIKVKEVYKGIDWVLYYSKEGNLKYDFIINSNANPNDIKLEYSGQEKPFIDNEGNLISKNSFGEIKENAPVIFQSNNKLESKWIINGGYVSIDISDVQKNLPFTIDPQVLWSTYAGGGSVDRMYSVFSDNNNVFISGGTYNNYFPILAINGSSYQQSYTGSADILIFKFDATNEQLLYTTYYGGTGDDVQDKNIIKTDNNFIYVIGITGSNDFPTLNPGGTTFYQDLSNCWNNGYLLRFAKTNCQRIWATYITAIFNDDMSTVVSDIVINEGNYIYITGMTNSPNFPIIGGDAPQGVGSAPDIYDCFIEKFDYTGTLTWSTYIGGNNTEWASSLALFNNNLYVMGTTYSTTNNFVLNMAGAYNQFFLRGTSDLFAISYNTTTNSKVWGSYFGGDGDEVFQGTGMGGLIAADNTNLYVAAGLTSASTINLTLTDPGNGAYFDNSQNGGNDILLLKWNIQNQLEWSTLFGGGSNERVDKITLDNYRIWLGGYTQSTTTTFPFVDPNDGSYFNNTIAQGLIAQFTKLGVLQWSTRWPSNDVRGVFADNNWLWTTGDVSSNSLPLFNPGAPAYYDASLNAGPDGFFAKFDKCVKPPITINPLTTTICLKDTATLIATSTWEPYITPTYIWTSPNITNDTLLVSPNVNTVYTVTGTDYMGCFNSTTATVNINPLPQLTITQPTAICLLDSITLTVNSNLPSTYLWTPTNTTDSTLTVSPTTPSQLYTYNVVVTDTVNGCINDTLASVYVNPLPQLIITQPTAICLFDSITFIVNSNLPSTYLWTPTNTTDSTLTVSPTTPSQIYTYNVVVTDTVNGCINDTLTSVYVNPLPQLTITQPTAICLLDSITLTVNSNLPSTYLWTPTNTTDSTITVSPTTPSQLYTYNVVVTDTVNGCINDTLTSVYVNPLPQLTITPPTAICLFDSITFVVNSNLPSTYLWTPTNTTDSTLTVSPTTPSQLYTYNVLVTDTVNGCINDTLTTLYVNPLPQFTITQSTSICYGDSITISATTDLPSDIYWYTPDTIHNSTTTLYPDSTGFTYTYISYAIDSVNSCKNYDTMTVYIMQKPVLSINQAYFMCPYETINVNVFSTMPVTYLWTPGSITDSSFAFHPLVSDTTYSYTVIGTSADGCKDTTSTVILVYPEINVSITPINPAICLHDSISLTGHGAITYSWYNQNQFSTDSIITLSPDTTTNYSLIGTSIYQCKDTANITLTVYPLPTFNVTGNQAICYGQSLNLSITNEFDTTASYLWQPNGLTGNSVILSPQDTTTYTVLSTDSNSCHYTVSFVITVDTLPIAQISGISPICYGETIELQASGGTSFVWQPGNVTTSTYISTPDSASTYIYTLIAQSTICYDTTTFSLLVNPKPILTITNDTTLIIGQDVLLNVTGANNYDWSPINDLSCVNCSSPLVEPNSTIEYCVIGTNLFSCSDTACVNITVDKECGEVFVPSGFSPNNDGENEVLYVYGKCVKSMEFKIFNRWGEKVFESTDPDIGWDGSFRGKPLDTDVFVYFLKTVYFNDVKVETKGNITLMR